MPGMEIQPTWHGNSTQLTSLHFNDRLNERMNERMNEGMNEAMFNDSFGF